MTTKPHARAALARLEALLAAPPTALRAADLARYETQHARPALPPTLTCTVSTRHGRHTLTLTLNEGYNGCTLTGPHPFDPDATCTLDAHGPWVNVGDCDVDTAVEAHWHPTNHPHLYRRLRHHQAVTAARQSLEWLSQLSPHHARAVLREELLPQLHQLAATAPHLTEEQAQIAGELADTWTGTPVELLQAVTALTAPTTGRD